MADDPGLAGPGAGEDEQGPVAVQDRLALLGIQFGEELQRPYSTVTLLARFRGWSTSQPRSTAMW